jgi:hypothetical protein
MTDNRGRLFIRALYTRKLRVPSCQLRVKTCSQPATRYSQSHKQSLGKDF